MCRKRACQRLRFRVGEQEHDQRRADRRLHARPPDALGGVVEAENLAPETEVDADINEHRPGERRRGGKHQHAAHDEHDRHEQREQPGDADDDAAKQRQAAEVRLVGVGLPQIDLRQSRRAQLGDVGDGRAGIDRQQERIRLGDVLALGRVALARGDGGDAGGAEVRPHHPRADETIVRRDQQARQLLVGVVDEREHRPVRTRARLQRADFDAADDAVGAGRRRDLQLVAGAGEILDRRGEVDGVVGDGEADDLRHRERPRPAERRRNQRQQRQNEYEGARPNGTPEQTKPHAAPRARAERRGHGRARRRQS